MDTKEFKQILKDNKLSLKEFSRLSEVPYNTCTQWGRDNRPLAPWVKSWIDLYLKINQLEDKLKRYETLEETIKAIAKD